MKNVYLLTVYPRLQAAEQTINDLIATGYSSEQVGVVISEVYQKPTHKKVSETTDREIYVYAVRLQQILNYWKNTSTYHVSGIGNLVLTGIFLDILSKSERFEDCLDTVGVPSQQIEVFLETLRRGDVVIGLHVPEAEIERVSTLLCHHEPVDMKRREQQWKNRGWQGFDSMSDPFSVEEIIRKKRQYSTPQSSNLQECKDNVVLRYDSESLIDS